MTTDVRPETTQGDNQDLSSRNDNRSQRPDSAAFRSFITSGWGPRPETAGAPGPAVAQTADRRARLAAQFPGERLVIPAGTYKPRSNDTDFRFRPHSAFAHLTGLGAEQEPDAVLVLDPVTGDDGRDGRDGTHEAVLYMRPLAGRDTAEFFSDSRYGEFWVGARPTLEDLERLTGIRTAHLDDLSDALAKDAGPAGVGVVVVPGVDATVEAVVEEIRAAEDAGMRDDALAEALSELRLIKDAHEVEQLRAAVAVTIEGFEQIVRRLPEAVSHRRGERVIEATFLAHARQEGNAVGYDTIAAAGAHATTLHWTDNDGQVRPGELVLIDAGAEVDSLYTADVTRTLPVDGTFTEVQRRVYQAVLDAADAAFAVARPGSLFREVHAAAMQVIAARLAEWGLLPVSAEESLSTDGQQHRRWMVHGTSHHLGLDVHDCAQARRELYLDAVIEPGMVFTIEPGLYFKIDDLLVPAEYRGIGVRIEDDVLVTADGNANLSAALPRRPDEVEAWMARLLAAR
ncbi:MAG: aminopeptidase P family protein [Cellulomonas sp.]|uniref:aminopeptidase P family protein n=1 Tax=Cellulomonas sp. TaxID=40001 RepID=UPI00185DD3EE|nr:aminopeptidase P family protein [Cellulomonas sp.]NMM15894.1 aminopeptidase P family protein [Cellulomonas sp.]NMM29529.1 aminopeptidase P family protein [Cellulomonas sp.]